MDLIAGIASALSELRRSPGKNESWIEGAAQTLERNNPELYVRALRRIGFARRLAQFAELSEIDQATLTVGLFFHELVASADPDAAPKVSRAWNEHLMMNDLWLDRAYAVAQAPQTEDWEDLSSMTNVIAKLAVEFDGALERKSRPLQVLQALRTAAETPVLEQATRLLWSEEGQELCDAHLRHRGQGYRIGPKEIRQSLETLRATARPAVAVDRPAVAHMRLVTNNRQERDEEEAPRREEHETYREASSEASSLTSLGNFEKRRQALRAGSARSDAPPPSAEEREAPHEPAAAPEPEPQPVPEPAEEPAAVNGVAVDDLWLPGKGPRREKEAAAAESEEPSREPERRGPRRLQMERREPVQTKKIAMEPQEETMVTTRTTSRYEANGAQDLIGGLQDLREWFDQLRRTAAEGEALLNQIAPQIQTFAARIVELEEMAARIEEVEELVDRWKGIKGATTRAA
jgi:hypothetical protein